jgi:hypothetical protein
MIAKIKHANMKILKRFLRQPFQKCEFYDKNTKKSQQKQEQRKA